jgi:hypothetical protein
VHWYPARGVVAEYSRVGHTLESLRQSGTVACWLRAHCCASACVAACLCSGHRCPVVCFASPSETHRLSRPHMRTASTCMGRSAQQQQLALVGIRFGGGDSGWRASACVSFTFGVCAAQVSVASRSLCIETVHCVTCIDFDPALVPPGCQHARSRGGVQQEEGRAAVGAECGLPIDMMLLALPFPFSSCRWRFDSHPMPACCLAIL